MLATGPNGKNIFFPFTGSFVEARLEGVGEYGYYMSSTLCESDEYMAYSIGLLHEVKYNCECYRDLGKTIRPVKD